jgi:feruloyl esterase
MGHLRILALAALLPLLAASASRAEGPQSDAQRCAALTGKTIAPDTVIQSASWKPEGDTVSTSVATVAVTQPFCRVIGVATPTRDSHIGFEVWLPPASAWNGNFRGEGSGGSAGNISPGPMNQALAAGYATMSTDNGHVDGAGGNYGLDWAYQHPEKMIDWGWRALHLSTVAAKQVVARFYGRTAGQNYFIACSAGGHHALMEATRFPADYDGYVAGAAPWKWTSLMLGHTWNSIPALKDPTAVTAESVAILNRRMTAACDKLDGVEDGLIADPRRCAVDPGEFQCKAGEAADCLTAVQVEAARHIYAGATRSDGTRLQQGQVRGTELGWVPLMTGARPGGSSWEFWKLAAFQDRSFENVKFDFDRDTDRALNAKVAGSTLAEVYDQKANLDAFRKRGGKFILFQGLADYQITPLMDVDFYNRLVARYGQQKTDGFLRFFLLPGMGHCSGGIGFSHIGGATGAPLKDDAGHDMVRALERWRMTGEAPSLFTAARMNGKAVAATRPVCRYPLEARYTGHGSTSEAANFTCRMPEKFPPQPM